MDNASQNLVNEKENLLNYLRCFSCKTFFRLSNDILNCSNCNLIYSKKNNIFRFIESDYHSNFGLQWNTFSKVQLDSHNGSTESEDRLFSQSLLSANDFKGLTILEIGSGNGRFTELFLKYGARVISVDYSTAIDAKLSNNQHYFNSHKFLPIQADLFELPLLEESFDMVFCYGVIQHTGNNEKALFSIAKFVKPKGFLFVDIYAISIKHYNIFVYLMRLIFPLFCKDEVDRLSFVKKFVDYVFPLQTRILSYLNSKNGIYKYIRYLINRSPNSVYGINLWLKGKISYDTAYEWSILDTYDGWAPKHDHPVTRNRWDYLTKNLSKKLNYKILKIGVSGQGHTAILQKNLNNRKLV